jgi:tetratricopeptide (TPR) repeat protein
VAPARQHSFERALSGAQRHSDDYAALLSQVKLPLDQRTPQGPHVSPAHRPHQIDLRKPSPNRGFSYRSDYGVYSSPLTSPTEAGGASSGGSVDGKGAEDPRLEERQQELIGHLGGQYRSLQRRLGPEHAETVAACGQYVEHSTGMATMYLETGRGSIAWKVLQQAEKAAETRPALMPAVQNGMACCLARSGRQRAALSMLQKAAGTVQEEGHSAAMRGNISLNLCATLSALGKHTEALEAAKESMQCLRRGLRETQDLGDAGGAEARRERADLAAMLAMALHNTAVQHEHLQQWQLALAAYQCAANCAADCLGTEHPIARSLRAVSANPPDH